MRARLTLPVAAPLRLLRSLVPPRLAHRQSTAHRTLLLAVGLWGPSSDRAPASPARSSPLSPVFVALALQMQPQLTDARLQDWSVVQIAGIESDGTADQEVRVATSSCPLHPARTRFADLTARTRSQKNVQDWCETEGVPLRGWQTFGQAQMLCVYSFLPPAFARSPASFSPGGPPSQPERSRKGSTASGTTKRIQATPHRTSVSSYVGSSIVTRAPALSNCCLARVLPFKC